MSDRAFLDSNILIYSVTRGDARFASANDLIEKGGVISTQVLNEFAHVVRRKLKWPWPDVRAASAAFRKVFPAPLAITAREHDEALSIADRDGLAFFDALIVASALKAGCSTLLTEDMQHGRVIEGRLLIRNPFPADRGV